MLRAAAGWDPREEHNKRLYCDDEFQRCGSKVSSGTVKLHNFAVNSWNIRTVLNIPLVAPRFR